MAAGCAPINFSNVPDFSRPIPQPATFLNITDQVSRRRLLLDAQKGRRCPRSSRSTIRLATLWPSVSARNSRRSARISNKQFQTWSGDVYSNIHGRSQEDHLLRAPSKARRGFNPSSAGGWRPF
jgi:hypothetical protein